MTKPIFGKPATPSNNNYTVRRGSGTIISRHRTLLAAVRAWEGGSGKGTYVFNERTKEVELDQSAWENPHFKGKLGTGQRFRECVAKVSKQRGVYDPEGLCAAIGRRKHGKRKMAAMAARGRQLNPRVREGFTPQHRRGQKYDIEMHTLDGKPAYVVMVGGGAVGYRRTRKAAEGLASRMGLVKSQRNPATTSYVGVVELRDGTVLKSSRLRTKAKAMNWARRLYKMEPTAKRSAVLHVNKAPQT